jgi:hypothetical protein
MSCQWVRIKDADIKNVWKSKSSGETVEITPDWYEQNGTPIDDDGEGFVYSHTEISTQAIENYVNRSRD